MKYVIVLGDGMADDAVTELGGKTPLEFANTPNLDSLAPLSEIGLCKTVPEGLIPASDVANMSVMGFDPKIFYTGRSPLEAVSLGIDLKPDDVTLRCNLVTLSDDEPFEDKVMLDYSAGEIPTKDSEILIKAIQKEFGNDKFSFYAGKSYKHCLVAHGGILGHEFTPPHNIYSKKIGKYLPKGENADIYLSFMKRSYEILKNHPINLKRIACGKNPANAIWLWGEGKKPTLPKFEDVKGLKGGLITAVDLVRGLGILSDLKLIDVDGITGNYDTNFKGKAQAALDALEGGLDFVYIHMEAPDECAHHGDFEKKIYSIEQIDRLVIKTLVDGFKAAGEDFALLVCPDHPTSSTTRTHTMNLVPYLLYSSKKAVKGTSRYTESEAKKTENFVSKGYMLIDKLLKIK